LFSFSCYAIPTARLEFSEGKVYVKDLDPEILFTFSRYYNTNEDWKTVFRITVRGADQTLDGQYEVGKTVVTFAPRFPFAPNVQYIATFDQAALSRNYNEVYLPNASSTMLSTTFSPKVIHSAPQVVEIYPTGNFLPENLLKFHIRFSSAMTRGEIYDRVKLYSGSNLIEKAFLIVDEELWDEEMTSVTLMFDPGRIKRGLRANVEMGPPLKAGHQYRLVIESGWPDQYGNETANTMEKKFTCVVADRERPDMNRWVMKSPTAGLDGLSIDLIEPFDVDVLLYSLRIRNQHGDLVQGKFTALKDQSILVFEPMEAWQGGTYTLECNPLIEDLAGNSIERLFDVDVTALPTAIVTQRTFDVVIQRQ